MSIYDEMIRVMTEKFDGGRNWIANCANASAAVFHGFNKVESDKVNWVGFYMVEKSGDLLLGPFQGILLLVSSA